jgi:ABC-type dipeptide/oligopeptide/nickel transport system permease component
MRTYITRRLLLLIPVLLGVSIIVFLLMGFQGPRWTAYITTERVNPAQIFAIEEKYHLNESEAVQYIYWLKGIVSGDWGYSKVGKNPVLTVIIDKFPATFELTAVSMIIAVLVGVKLGSISAVRRNKPLDHVTRTVALIGVSIPIFWLGLLLLNLFFYQLGWAPPGDRLSEHYLISTGDNVVIKEVTGFYLVDTLLMLNFGMFLDALWHLILPAITLSFGTIAILTRIMRSSMLEVMNQDYIKTARSKGLPEKVVINKHARKNALIPTTTVSGMAFGGLLAGAVLTESIYTWPGLGRWSTQAIIGNDPAAIMGFSLFIAIVYVLANLVVDIMYVYLDPRVKLE